MRGLYELVRRFRDDERGVFAVLFGVFAIVLIAAAGAVVDFTRVELARTKAQQALDSAALGLAPTIYDDGVTEETLMAKAQGLVLERLNDGSLTVNVNAAEVDLDEGTLNFQGSITVPMAFVQLIGIPSLTARVQSEATKSSSHIEVAVALDVTYSMNGSKINALEDAAGLLIDRVVKNTQAPTTSRMALVPYSMGVNLGDYADQVRGAPLPGKPITGASWIATTGKTSGTITGITRQSTGVITSSAHGLSTGDRIAITDVRGMTQVNNKAYRVVRIDSNKFSLQTLSSGSTVNTSNYSNYTSGGTWRKCALSTCEIKITANNHGFNNDDWVAIDGVGGLTGLNNNAFQVKSKDTNSFLLKDTVGIDYGTTYTGGGNVYCTENEAASRPCEFFRFRAVDNSYRLSRITTCVTERASNTYTTAPPETFSPVATNWFGRHYPNGNNLNECLTDQIVLMTSNKDDLHALADNLTAAGTTAGHIGLAWAWYMLSTSFNYLWPEEHRTRDPLAENAEPVLKVLVLMTDGDFNTAYCKGVVSSDSNSVAGNNSQRINCNAPDDSTDQAEALCEKIKTNNTPANTDDDIIIYTVGFALNEITNAQARANAQALMASCASPGKNYTANSEAQLLQAFRDIGRDITGLRLSK